ncbi:TPA_asm: N [Hedera alphacytorhabdovirus 1]|nr:TPA_asm: N [Hedera alphacytorhabdovirus 1]
MADVNQPQETIQERVHRLAEARRLRISNQGANQQQVVDKTVRKPKGTKEFDGLDSVSVGKRTSDVWSDNHLSQINIYPVKQVASTEIISLGEILIKALSTGTSTSSTVDICLTLAVSLGKPAEASFSSMLSEPPEDQGSKLPWVAPDSTKIAKTSGLSYVQRRTLNMAKTNLATETDEAKRDVLTETIKNLEDQEAGIIEPQSQPTRSTDDANAYCFMASLLLKLYSKSVESFMKGIESWKTRFAAWYDSSSSKITEFKPTESNITGFRTILARRPEIWSTWVWWVAHNENAKSLLITQQGLLNYVACQQYAYSGMHAYSLLVDIHEKTGMTFGKLLQYLNCPITRNGVRVAADIIRNHEITSKNANRTTYFRYARIWNPKYFSALQSSNCRTLLYVTAKVNKMVSTQGQGGDPMEIYALKDMDEAITKRLDVVATTLAERIIDHMLIDEESGDVWANK